MLRLELLVSGLLCGLLWVGGLVLSGFGGGMAV